MKRAYFMLTTTCIPYSSSAHLSPYDAQDPIENVELVALTLALNYGKFRRYVTREEVGEWANNFRIEALKEAKANLKGRIAEIGNIKKAWEKPVQVKSKEYRPDMICLTTLLRGVWTRPREVQ